MPGILFFVNSKWKSYNDLEDIESIGVIWMLCVSLKKRNNGSLSILLTVVPKQGIEKKHNSIPNEIGVSTETGFFESDAETYWKEVKMKVDDIVSKVDLIVKRATWGNDKTSINWKTYTDQVDNDAAIYLDKESLTIREFSFRADLREKELSFLKNMIELGKENGWSCLWTEKEN
ncbi:MAG: hypothetical protein HC905_01960 [Bacteroidales bacterium]|nr:hypothetical protein [Bacteroidales bacterium]